MTSLHMRPAVRLTSVLALGIALSLAAGIEVARASADKGEDAQKKPKTKGKAGDHCKKASECEQPLTCATVGDHKECAEAPPRPMIPPPT